MKTWSKSEGFPVKRIFVLTILSTLPQIFLIHCKSSVFFQEEKFRKSNQMVFIQTLPKDHSRTTFESLVDRHSFLVFDPRFYELAKKKAISQKGYIQGKSVDVSLTSYSDKFLLKHRKYFPDAKISKYSLYYKIREATVSIPFQNSEVIINFFKTSVYQQESDSLDSLVATKEPPKVFETNDRIIYTFITPTKLWKTSELALMPPNKLLQWNHYTENNGVVPYPYTEYLSGTNTPVYFRIMNIRPYIYQKNESQKPWGFKIFAHNSESVYYYLNENDMQLDLSFLDSKKDINITQNFPFIFIKNCETLCN
jgi:hypothetical protein